MSFPRAKTKRFNEEQSCAPGVGYYSVKDHTSKVKGLALPVSGRFKEPKDPGPKAVDTSLNFNSPLKKALSYESLPPPGSTRSSSKSRRSYSQSQEERRVKELESEVRRLIQYQTDLDRQRQQEKDDVKKLEGKLQGAMRDKVQLQATLAKTEKQLQDLCRIRDTFKTKVQGIEASNNRQSLQQSKEFQSLQKQYESKSEQIIFEKVELEGKLVCLECSMEETKNSLKTLEEEKQEYLTSLNASDELLGNEATQEESLRRQMSSLVKEIAATKLALMSADGRCRELKANLEQSERTSSGRLTSLTAEYERLEVAHEATKKQHSVTLQDLEGQVRIRRSEVQEMSGECDGLRRRNETLTDSIGAHEDTINSLRKSMEEETNLRKQSEVDSCRMKNELKFVNLEINDLQDELEKGNRRSADLEERHRALGRDAAARRAELVELGDCKRGLEDLLDGNEERIGVLRCEVKGLEDELEQAISHADETDRELKERNRNIESLVELHKGLGQDVEEFSRDVQQRPPQSKREIASVIESTKSKWITQLTALEIDGSHGDTEGFSLRLVETQTTIMERIAEWKSLAAGRDEVIAVLQRELEGARIELSEGAASLMDLESDRDKKGRLCRILEDRVGDLGREVEWTLGAKSDAENERDGVAATLETMLAKLVTDDMEMERLRKVKDEAVVSLEEELTRARQRLAALSSELQTERKGMRESIENLTYDLECAQAKVALQAADHLSYREEQNGRLEGFRSRLERKEEETRKETVAFEELLGDKDRAVADLSRRFEETRSKLTAQAADFGVQREERETELVQLRDRLGQSERSSEERHGAFQRALSEREEALKALASDLADTKERLAIGSAEALISETERAAEIESLTAEMARDREAAGQTVRYLQQAIDSKLREISKLSQDFERLCEEASMQEADLQILEEEKDKEMGEIADKLRAATDSLRALRLEHEETRAAADEELLAVTLRLEESDRRLGAQGESARLERREWDEDRERTDERIALLGADVVVQTSEMEALKRTTESEMSGLRELLAAAEETSDSLRRELRSRARATESEERERGEELSRLRETSKRATGEAVDLRQRLEEMGRLARGEIARLEREVGDESKKSAAATKKLRESCTRTEAAAAERLRGAERTAELQRDEMRRLRDETKSALGAAKGEYETKLLEARNGHESVQEGQRWKTLYEELLAKVEPFQDQLNQFQAEKQFLLDQRSSTESDLNALSQEYAKLLGHQNNKQKIHHVVKLKEENMKLKKTVDKLREDGDRKTRSMRSLREKLDKAESTKRFDPSKSFVHKENKVPLSTVN